MKTNETQTTNEAPMSLSKQRKLARKAEIKKAKRNAKIQKVVTICVTACLLVLVVGFGGKKIYRAITAVKPTDDYSAGLTAEGLIDGVTATSAISSYDFSSVTVPLSEVEYSDEAVQSDIDSILSQNATLDSESAHTVAEGDKINLDYVATLNGEAVDDQTTEGAGTDLTVGSSSMVDGFDTQLVGHDVGEVFTLEVTFPDDYSDAELASQIVQYDVTINGVYVTPEFDDEFVQTNLSEYASTADEYRQYLKDTNYETNMTEWINTYITDNITITSMPEDYLNQIVSLQKYTDQQQYEYYNSYYQSTYGSSIYGGFEDYIGTSEEEYDKALPTTVEPQLKVALVCQAIAESQGITYTAEDLTAYLTELGYAEEDITSLTETYGTPYLMQMLIQDKGFEYIESQLIVS